MGELWELEKRQIEALQSAKVEALGICGWVARLCEAVRDNRPEWSCYAIGQLLDHRNEYPLPHCLKVVGFFIDQVHIPVKVPWSPMAKTLSLRSMKKCPSAHGGAVTLWNAFHGFLSRKLTKLCPDVGVILDVSQTADMLVDQYWETLRRELADAAQFNCDAIRDAISREAQAAMEVCNAMVVSALANSAQPTPRPTPDTGRSGETQPASGFLGGMELAKALGVDPTRRDAFFKHLERKRFDLGDASWHQVSEPHPNSPRFLYRVNSTSLQELAAAYTKPKPP